MNYVPPFSDNSVDNQLKAFLDEKLNIFEITSFMGGLQLTVALAMKHPEWIQAWFTKSEAPFPSEKMLDEIVAAIEFPE